MMGLQETARRRLQSVDPYYDPPEGELKRFDQNVNLLGPHPASGQVPDLRGLNLYPTRDNRPLAQALARRLGQSEDRIIVGNGSDEILDITLRVLAEPGQTLATPTPCYSMYQRLARLNRLRFSGIATDANFQPSVADLLESRPDVILLCNPNNPVGSVLPPDFLRSLLKSFEGPVLVDEAYAEFAGVDATPLLATHENLIVIRTLSKAYGLAGLRVGYGLAIEPVAELLRRMKPPFSVNLLSERIAVAALEDAVPVEVAVATIQSERRRLAAELVRLGFSSVESGANFLLARPPMEAQALQQRLRDAGVLVRRYPQEPRLRDYLRFTIGGPAETAQLVEAVRRAMSTSQVRA